MTTKTSLVRVVSNHFDTLRDAKTERRSVGDVVVHYVAPVVAAFVVVALGLRITDAGHLLTALSILAGISFALSVLVFQLRTTTPHDPRLTAQVGLVELIDELFWNVTYATLVGLVIVGVAAFGMSVEAPGWLPATWGPPLNAAWTGFLIGAVLHYGITFAMCLKRLAARGLDTSRPATS